MPQVAKSEEQKNLENRIARTRSLLTNMTSQLRSLRSRNKAALERQRRQQAVEKNSMKGEQMFNTILAEVEAEKEKAKLMKAKLREELLKEGLGIYADLDDLTGTGDEQILPGKHSGPVAGSSKDKRPMQ